MHHNNRNRQNQQNNWHRDQHSQNRNHQQDNYDYGNYTSGGGNTDQNHGSYEGAPSGYQREFYPGDPIPYDGMHGHNDYGYAGGNPDFTPAAGEFRGGRRTEANNHYGVGTGRTDGFFGPHNDRQTDMGTGFSGHNAHYNDQRQHRSRPMGQTMDSWDRDDNHWHAHNQMHDQNRQPNRRQHMNRQPIYQPQNQGYFGENMPRHSGGNLYNERFRNNESTTRFNREEGRWHADSLSDRNIEGWGR